MPIDNACTASNTQDIAFETLHNGRRNTTRARKYYN